MKSSVRCIVAIASLGVATFGVGSRANADQSSNADQRGCQQPSARKGHAHGLVQLAGEALTEVNLRPEQEKAIEKIGKQVEPSQEAVDKAENDIHLALADQIENGRIDRRALDRQVKDYVDAKVAASGAMHEALGDLHSVLDPDQRSQFVEALECKLHHALKEVKSDKHFEKWAEKLDLTKEQREAIRDEFNKLVPAMQKEHDRFHNFLDSFRSEDFDAQKSGSEGQARDKAERRAERMIDLTEAVTKILTPEQRSMVADKLRSTTCEKPSQGELRPGGIERRLPGKASPSGEQQGEEDVGTSQQEWVYGAPGFGWGGAWAPGLYGGYGLGFGRAYGLGYGLGYGGFYGSRFIGWPGAFGWGFGW